MSGGRWGYVPVPEEHCPVCNGSGAGAIQPGMLLAGEELPDCIACGGTGRKDDFIQQGEDQ